MVSKSNIRVKFVSGALDHLKKFGISFSEAKALVFSKGQLSKNLSLYFGNDKIEFVNNFNYLGLIFSRGCSFKYTLEKNVKKANIAMYNILKKGRLLNLSIQCQYDLFDKIVSEKGRDLTQSYDKSPYTDRTI